MHQDARAHSVIRFCISCLLSLTVLVDGESSSENSIWAKTERQAEPETTYGISMETYNRGDVNISYYTKGTGQAVLFLHGFPDTSALWDQQVKALVSKNFKVIVPDMLGFGASSKPKDLEAYRVQNVVEVMYGLLDHLGVEKIILVGHDWGAFIAWNMAAARPDRCQKAVVLSIGHALAFFTAGGMAQREKSWYMLLFQDPQAEEILKTDDWALWRDLMGSRAPNNAFAEKQIENMSKQGALTAGLNWYRANVSAKLFGMTKPLPLPKLNVPILGIWSSKDSFLTEEQMTASARYVEDGRFSYKRIENASHWMQIDAPQELNRALLDFLQEPTVVNTSNNL